MVQTGLNAIMITALKAIVNCMNYHDDQNYWHLLHKQLAKEKYKKARESMEFNLKTIAEDNYWFDDYYTGVKRLLIRKLFDPHEPYITPAYVRDNNIFII